MAKKRRSRAKQTKQNQQRTELVVLRDEKRIAQRKRLGKIFSGAGFLIFIGGMALIFVGEANPNVILYQVAALTFGWLLSQVGLYLTHRYLRTPRPDQVLDKALKKEWQRGRLYHYVLPAPHVMLTEAGPVLFVLKYQTGNISVEGEKWRQRGIGFRRFFGQDGLGNPTREANDAVRKMAGFIKKHVPELADKDLPIGVIIVFTHVDRQSLDIDRSSLPAVHHSKLSQYLRLQGIGEPLPEADYLALRHALDEAAAGVEEQRA